MSKAHKGFTLIELLIVIVIILLLAAILLPVFSEARKTAYQVVCLNNLKQIGIAFRLYSEDWSGYLPLFSHYGYDNPQCWPTLWGAMIQPYIGGSSDKQTGWNYLVCPSRPSKDYQGYSYAVNYPFIIGYPANTGYGQKGSAKLSKVPSQVFVVADSRMTVVYHPQWWWFNADWDNDGVLDTMWQTGVIYNGLAGGAHRQGADFLFGDTHAKYVRTIDFVTNKNGLWGEPNYSLYR